MEEKDFQDRIAEETKLLRKARHVLGVSEEASAYDARKAWRQACIDNHPDRNAHDPSAERRFRLANCAYRFLTEGTPCRELSEIEDEGFAESSSSEYSQNSKWGFFLWWRETFF